MIWISRLECDSHVIAPPSCVASTEEAEPESSVDGIYTGKLPLLLQ